MPREEAEANEEVIEQADVGSNVMEMSDEDFLNEAESNLNTVEVKELEPASEEEEEEVEEQVEENLGEDDDVEEDEAKGDDDDHPEAKESTEDDQPEDASADEESTVDYKAEYEKLFGPIKAGGKTIKMRDMDQVINRVQLAENYNKKMQAMKPHTRMLKTLEKAELLGNEDQLNFLLDLKAQKPEAIKKLVADSGIDLMDLADDEQLEESKQYRPNNHMISEQEAAIDDAFKSISTSESYKDTINVMTDSFDQRSRDIISTHPEYIQSLNSDIENGIYNEVMNEVNYNREMGYIPNNVSDIEAYIGTVQLLAQQEQQQEQQQPTQNQQPKRQVNTQKRKAMASPGSGSSKGKKQFDPMNILEMSDADFEKEFGKVN